MMVVVALQQGSWSHTAGSLEGFALGVNRLHSWLGHAVLDDAQARNSTAFQVSVRASLPQSLSRLGMVLA